MANRIEKLQRDVLRGVMGDMWDSESIKTGTRTIKNIFIKKKKRKKLYLSAESYRIINSVHRRLKVKHIQ